MTKWTKEEDKLIKKLYFKITGRELCDLLNQKFNNDRNEVNLRGRVRRLGLQKKSTPKCKEWISQEIKYLKENDGKILIKQMMKELDRSRGSISGKLKEIRIASNKIQCPICHRKCLDQKGLTVHICNTKEGKHLSFVKNQREMVDNYFYTGKKVEDLLKNKDFYFGYDWVYIYSKKNFNKDWIHNKEIRLKKRKCLVCGKEFKCYISRKSRRGKYCCWEHYLLDDKQLYSKCQNLGREFQNLVKKVKITLGERENSNFLYEKEYKNTKCFPDFRYIDGRNVWQDAKLSKSTLENRKCKTLRYLNYTDKLEIIYLIEDEERVKHPDIQYISITNFYDKLKSKDKKELICEIERLRGKVIQAHKRLEKGA